MIWVQASVVVTQMRQIQGTSWHTRIELVLAIGGIELVNVNPSEEQFSDVSHANLAACLTIGSGRIWKFSKPF